MSAAGSAGSQSWSGSARTDWSGWRRRRDREGSSWVLSARPERLSEGPARLLSKSVSLRGSLCGFFS